MKDIHFISGLPRAGSTLLAAILGQNPRFTTGMSSPVVSYYRAMKNRMSKQNELSVNVTNKQRAAILKGLFANYYEDSNDVVFDTSRSWMAEMVPLAQLFPDYKMICCVRDIAWIMDSFERLRLKNPLEPSSIYDYNVVGNVATRCAYLGNGDGVVGWSVHALREAMAGDENGRIMLVEYSELCQRPQNVLNAIYKFLEETPFIHNLQNVQFNASEFDFVTGAPGMHTVNGPVVWEPRSSILPPTLFNSYVNDNFWRDR